MESHRAKLDPDNPTDVIDEYLIAMDNKSDIAEYFSGELLHILLLSYFNYLSRKCEFMFPRKLFVIFWIPTPPITHFSSPVTPRGFLHPRLSKYWSAMFVLNIYLVTKNLTSQGQEKNIKKVHWRADSYTS